MLSTFSTALAFYVWLADFLSIPLLFPFLAICVISLDHELKALRVLWSSASWKRVKLHCSVVLELTVNSYERTPFTINAYCLNTVLLSYVTVQNNLLL